MDDLVQFLRDRLDQDEAAAKAAGGDEIEATPSLWGTKYLTLHGSHDDRHTTELPAELADHIARHDPARVLREIDAKRQALSRYEAMAAGVLVMTGVESILAEYRRVILPSMALPYADRPGYREEWRP